MNRIVSQGAAQMNHSISVIGLGSVGGAVCRNLLKQNYKLVNVFDAYKDNVSFGEGVNVCSNVEDAVRGSDIVITALPKPENIKELVVNQRMFECMNRSSIWIDHSTTDYFQTLDFAKEAKEQYDISTLECPLTGGVTLLKQGQMTMFVGGERDKFDECKPYLECSSNNLMYLGEIGTAS